MYSGSISKLSDGRWMVQINLGKDNQGKRKRYSKGCKDKQTAEEHLRLKLQELNGSVSNPTTISPIPPTAPLPTCSTYTSMTFEEYAVNFLNVGTGKASSRTIENYRMGLTYVSNDLGKLPMTEITRQDLIKAFSTIKYQYADSILQKTFTVVRLILQTAYEDGHIPTNPTKQWKRPRSAKPKDKDEEFAVFSNDDLKIIFENSKEYNIELYTQFVLLACTGIRPAEMRALCWSAFDPKNKTIKIYQAITDTFEEIQSLNEKPKGKEVLSVTKSGYSIRKLTLSDLAVQALIEWRRILSHNSNKAKAESSFIFPNRDGSFKSRSGCENTVKRFKKKYGLEYLNIHFYKFRHTMCTNLILANQPIPVIQRIMGDDTTSVIMKFYTHISQEKALRSADDFYKAMNENNSQIMVS